MRSLPLLLLLGAAALGVSWFAGTLPATALADAGAPRLQQPAAQEPDAEDEDEEGDENGEPEGREPDEIRRELQAALRERELTIAQQAIAGFEHEVRVTDARFALENARAEQDVFETHRQRSEIAAAELDLAHRRDEAQDAEEEMEQLAQMYGENELADRTAEIVLRRARRGLERAREELRIAEEDHRHLLQTGLPREQLALHHAVLSAELDLRLADFEAEAMRLEHAHALAEHDATIADLRAELAEAEAAAEVK
jgi:hypothetical protein